MSNNNINNDDVSMYYPDGDSAHMTDDDLSTQKIAKNVRKKPSYSRKKKSKPHWVIIAVVLVVYAVFLLVGSWLLFYKPEQPNTGDVPFNTDPVDQTPGGKDDPPIIHDDPDDKYNVREGVYNILVVAHDKEAHLADVTMLVNCDTVNNTISVMQIPRDTYVGLQLSTNKINEAFARYYGSQWSATGGTMKEVCLAALDDYESMLEQNLCINIDYNILMNLSGFRNIVDAIGGVPIYVPHEMVYDDPAQDLYINLPEGYRVLNGDEAEQFVRFRDNYVQADLGRVNAQKIFLTAMFNQVKSVIKDLDIPAMNSLATEVFNNVYTEMNVSNILFFAKFLLKVDLSQINMTTIPGNMAGNHYVINREATLSIINQYFNIYTKKISDSIFDRNSLFCDKSSEDIRAVYYADAEDVLDHVYNADDINSGSIDIPILNK